MKYFWDEHLPLLLLAPPAWGKTHLIKEWMKQQDDVCWLYISPLRALAHETFLSLRSEIETIFLSEEKILPDVFKKKSFCLIGTPESIMRQNIFERLPQNTRIVVDEIHLFYHWGESFRPTMMECLREAIALERSLCLLTATLSKSMSQLLSFDLSQSYSEMIIVDEGNYCFKNRPAKTFCMSSGQIQRAILKKIFTQEKETIMLFCRYRQEVDQWGDFFRAQKIDCVTCKGGEVKDFVGEMSQRGFPPRVIVATTTLSHGVNLPSFESVFLTYEEQDPDFKLQMSTRGGRRGEKFELFHQSKRWRDYIFSLGKDIINRIQLIPFEEEQACLQKAFSYKKSLLKNAI